jgi:hypothetical protein
MKIARFLVCSATVSMIWMAGATDAFLGTWKMDVAKSKFGGQPAPKNVTTVYTQEGDWIVLKSTGIDASGQPISRANRYKRDGKSYPFDGPNGKGTITVKIIDDHTTEAVTKLEGGHAVTTKSVISKDGKTRTQTSTGSDAKGRPVNASIVFVRQ